MCAGVPAVLEGCSSLIWRLRQITGGLGVFLELFFLRRKVIAPLALLYIHIYIYKGKPNGRPPDFGTSDFDLSHLLPKIYIL